MGCRFCASTIGGLTRCLKPSGDAGSDLPDPADTGERVSNVVVMGTGEPMDNYDNLVRFVRILTGRKRSWDQSEKSDGFYLWDRSEDV